MNRNIIKIGLLLGTSVLANTADLKVPGIDLYADNLVPKARGNNGKMPLSQFSLIQNRKYYIDASSTVFSQTSNVSVRSTLHTKLDDAEILTSVVQRIQESKPLPEEFSKMIDDNFWDLI